MITLKLIIIILIVCTMPMSKDERNAKRRARYAIEAANKRRATAAIIDNTPDATSFENEWNRRKTNQNKSKRSRARIAARKSKARYEVECHVGENRDHIREHLCNINHFFLTLI